MRSVRFVAIAAVLLTTQALAERSEPAPGAPTQVAQLVQREPATAAAPKTTRAPAVVAASSETVLPLREAGALLLAGVLAVITLTRRHGRH